LFYSYLSAGDMQSISVAFPPSDQTSCSRCGILNPSFCTQDCAGVYRGTAFEDECDDCVGGTTGNFPGQSKDCAGICYGPYAIMAISNEGSVCRCDATIPTSSPNFALCPYYPLLPADETVASTLNELDRYVDTELGAIGAAFAIVLLTVMYRIKRRFIRQQAVPVAPWFDAMNGAAPAGAGAAAG